MKSKFRITMALAIAGVFAALAIPSAASAGTLFHSQSCVPAGNASSQCWFTASLNNQFGMVNTYCRFGMVDQFSWYPSHRVILQTAIAAGGNGYYPGSWTSARFAYSPVGAADMAGTCTTGMNTTSSLGRTYNDQLYIGTY